VKPSAAAAAKRVRLPATVVALGIVSFFNDTSSDMVIPLLPRFVAMLGGGPQALGAIEGVADATASLSQLASGYMADRIGRLKGLTLFGYAIPSLIRPLLSAVSVWPQVLGIRFIDRVGKGLRTPPRDALLAASAPAEIRGRAYGFHRALDNAGAIAGPLAAYLMLAGGLSLREVFAWTALPGLIAVLVLAVSVRRAPRPANIDAGPPPSIGLPPSPIFRRYLLSVFVFTLGCSSDTFLLWRANEIGIAVAYAPLLWIVLHVVKASSSTWGGTLSDRAGRRAPILAGWAIYALAYLGFALANAPWQMWALFAVYGMFFGLTEGAEKALVVDLVDESWRGRALGAYHAAVGMAALPASVIFGVVYQHAGPVVAFSMGAGLAGFAAILLPRNPSMAARS
jgi:MFS family permease